LNTTTPSPSDSRLTRHAVRGSSRAFEAIFERYHQDLYRYCAAIVGNAADAQDAVQSTMVKVLQALPGEERRIELKPWLYRIAHNEAIEIVRHRAPTEEIDADSLLGGPSAAEEAMARERLRRLVADVAELPERQRGALVMRELAGLGFEEIGAALETSAATARQTVYEARLGLRRINEGREMDCGEALKAISDGDRRVLRGRKLRAHLRACESCRDFRDQIETRRADLALVAPLPAVAAAGILHALLGGSAAGAGGSGAAAGAGALTAGTAGGGSGAAAVGTVGAAAGKSIFSAAMIKVAAAVGVVAAIGVTAADNRGLIEIGSGGPKTAPPAKSAPPRAGNGEGAGSVGAAGAPPAGSAVERAGARPAKPRVAGRRPLATPAGANPGSGSRPATGVAAAPGQSPGAAPLIGATAPPAHADNGRHRGQVEGHGSRHAAAAAAKQHGQSAGGPRGKPATAPSHAKSTPGAAAPASTGNSKAGSSHPKARSGHGKGGSGQVHRPATPRSKPKPAAPEPTGPEESPAATAHGKAASE
jgi:RNA polymerase sigma factor (sigma-70 family)